MAEQPEEHMEEQPLDIDHMRARIEELERELERKIVELAGKDQEINVLRDEKRDLEAVVERNDTQLRSLDTELRRKEAELNTVVAIVAEKNLTIAKEKMEKLHQRYLYGITTLLLSIFLVVIIANRHMGLSSYQQSYAVCTQRVVELTERAGAFEESSTKSLTVIKQLEESMARYSKQADQAVKDKEKCKKQLDHKESEKYQYFQNMSLLDGDKRELNVKLMTCSDQLVKCGQEADELDTKLSDAAKEKDEYVHHLKHEEIRYHVLSRNNVAISEQLTMCNEQLGECKLSKQEIKTAEEFKFNVLIVAVVGMMGALVAVSVFCSNKQNK